MKQKKLNNYVYPVPVKSITKKDINLTKDFLIFYEYNYVDKPFFIFLRIRGELYPVNNFKALSELIHTKKKFSGMIFENPSHIIQIFNSLLRENSLNIIEKIQLSKFLKFFKLEKLVPHFQIDHFLKYEEILTLPDEAIDFIAQDIIPLDLAIKLKILDSFCLKNFLKIIYDFKLTQSQQREVFNFIKDETYGKKFQLILVEAKDRDALIQKIREITMPQYMQIKKIFMQNKKNLNLPAGVNLLETPFFESRNMKIEIFFRNYQEIKDKINKLSKNLIDKKEIWEEIFNII